MQRLFTLKQRLINSKFSTAQLPKRSPEPAQKSGSWNGGGGRSESDQTAADLGVLMMISANIAISTVNDVWEILPYYFSVNYVGVSVDALLKWRVETLMTSAFSHNDTENLLRTAFGLYLFGKNVARTFGRRYFLQLYAIAVFASFYFEIAYLYCLSPSSKGQPKDKIPGTGPNGPVYAMMLLDLFLNPRAKLNVPFFKHVPAMVMGIFLIGSDMLRIIEGNGYVSVSTHLLGGAAATSLALYRIKKGHTELINPKYLDLKTYLRE